MDKRDFYFDLPPELIAQTALEKRDSSRLLTLDKNSGAVGHRIFSDLPELLRAGDCLVLNDSRVIPARLIGNRPGTGGAVELILLTERENGLWECLVKPGRRLRENARIEFGGGELTASVEHVKEDGNRLVRFDYSGIFLETLERLGQMPLPPYITKRLDNPERYQTVYSKPPGSAAAPTAGLHFTEQTLERIRDRGVDVRFLTLHVGLGTFRPVKVNDIRDHTMHSEFCIVPEATADAVNAARENGGRVVAVGTTSCRTLEYMTGNDGRLQSGSVWNDIFIYPGYSFRQTDALLTNFHLPESTLIMLISAMAGRENVLAAYAEAIAQKYRFFSFGDAMLIY